MSESSLPAFPRRRRGRKIVAGIVIAIAGLVGASYLIPVGTSGTISYQDAAPRDTEFVEVAGLDIAITYLPSQNSTTRSRLFVLLHGFGASSFSWRDVTEDLSQQGSVLAYDRTGFGFSERPERFEGQNPYGSEAQCVVLRTLIERFGPDASELVLVGHSAGGTLALDCTISGEVTPSHLVLIAPAALSGGAPSGIRVVSWIPPLDRLGPLLVRGISESGNDLLFDSVVDQGILTEEVLAGYRAPLTVVGWEQGLWEFTVSPRRDVSPEGISQITIPTLVITGDSDEIVPPEDSADISQLIPGASLVTFDRVGHLPQEENPGGTVAEIDRFLRLSSPK